MSFATALSGAVEAIFGSSEAQTEAATPDRGELERESRQIQARLDKIPPERPDLIFKNDQAGLRALEVEERGLRGRMSDINEALARIETEEAREARQQRAREAEQAGSIAYQERLSRGAALTPEEAKRVKKYTAEMIDAGREMQDACERLAKAYGKHVRASTAAKSVVGSRTPVTLLGTLVSKVELDVALGREMYRVSSSDVLGSDPFLLPMANAYSLVDRNTRTMKPLAEVVADGVAYLRRLVEGKAS